jgi:hypothetical protein
MLAISLWFSIAAYSKWIMVLILLTFQGHEWAHMSAIVAIVFYNVFTLCLLEFWSYLLMRWTTIVCYLSSKQSTKDCSSDFTGMFIFNILQVEWSLYSPFTLESIVSIDITPQF